jgi:hypothetical protein
MGFFKLLTVKLNSKLLGVESEVKVKTTIRRSTDHMLHERQQSISCQFEA